MQLLWLRSDLRQHDNTALSASAERGPTVAVYLISPEQWLAHENDPRLSEIVGNLEALVKQERV